MTKLDAGYWRDRYKKHETGWDIGSISTPLRDFFHTRNDKHIRILVPGAGNCYEGQYLLEHGFTDITILDFAPEALAGFAQRVHGHARAKLVCEDFFSHTGQYDLIVEQTFFCALEPARRPDYVKKMHELLKPGGELSGVLFLSVPNREGPPFAASQDEYRRLFAETFEIVRLAPCYNSIAPRAGRELFFTLRRK